MFCGNCGKKNDDNAVFCEGCGARLVRPEESSGKTENNAGTGTVPPVQPTQSAQTYQQPTNAAFDEHNIPEEYRPIGMWGYFGYEILFSIPIVGFILLIVFSITARNKNLKNFARSYFCFLIIVVVIVAIVVGGVGVAAFRFR